MGTQYLSLLSRRAALPANRTAHTFAAGLAALALVSVGAVVAVFWCVPACAARHKWLPTQKLLQRSCNVT